MMSSKKETASKTSASAKPKGTVKKEGSKKATPKTSKTRKKGAKENKDPLPSFSEAVAQQVRAHAVADLALKIATSDLKTTTNHALMIHNAVWQAERLLATVEGKRELKVHAFQLFCPNERMMTFAEVAERFKEHEWPGKLNSETTVVDVVETILKAARDAIRKDIAHSTNRREWKIVPIRRQDIERRVDRLLTTAFRHWGIDDVTDDLEGARKRISNEICHVLNHCLTPTGWRPPTSDLRLSGPESFADYAMEPPDFDRFLRDGEIELEDEDIPALADFFSVLKDETKLTEEQLHKRSAKILELVERASWIPAKVRMSVSEVVKLAKSGKSPVQLRSAAAKAATEFQELRNVRHCLAALLNLKNALLSYEFEPLPGQLSTPNSSIPLSGESIQDEIDVAIKRAQKTGKLPNLGTIKGDIEMFLQKLNDADAADTPIAKALKWAEKQLNEAERPLPKLRKNERVQLLDSLLSRGLPRLTPRRFRAYEVFVYAAQANLLSGKLTAPRRKIAPESLLSPPRPLEIETSILKDHPGILHDDPES